MKKFLKIFLSVIVVLAVAIALLWGRDIRTIASVHQVGDNKYLYEMECFSKYDLDDVLANNIDGNTDLVNYIVKRITKGIPVNVGKSAGQKPLDFDEHCTSFQARRLDGDGWLYGRNYDYFKNPSLVLHSHPKKGYASLCNCDLSHLGYGLEKLPDTFFGKLLCIAAVYAPMDGINEKGLCTSIMALPNQPARQDSGKPIAGTSILMRLWLDRCATVDEALALLETVDVRHDVVAGAGYHYMVADANGDCAVVEFDLEDGWKTMVVRKGADDSYMHVTNHLLSPKYYTTEPDIRYGNPFSKSWWRYDTVRTYLDAHNGTVTLEEALECLSQVHWENEVWPNGLVEDTQYSALYDQSSLTMYLRPWSAYGTALSFGL